MQLLLPNRAGQEAGDGGARLPLFNVAFQLGSTTMLPGAVETPSKNLLRRLVTEDLGYPCSI